jgi:hypothetical protein
VIRRAYQAILLTAAFAAVSSANSVLGSLYPLGMPVQPRSGMALSMGHTWIAVADEENTMLGNPANLGNVDRTVFSGVISWDFLNIHQDDASSHHLAVFPKQFSLAFPLAKAGAIAFAFERPNDATVKYRITQRGGTAGLETVDSLQLGRSRNGGVTAWRAGWGMPIGKFARVGLGYAREYLTIDDTRISTVFGREFDVSTDGFWRKYRYDERDSSGYSGGGNALRGGVMVTVPKFPLTVGVTGEYHLQQDMTRISKSFAGGDTVLSSSEVTAKVQLPPSLGIGLSYKLGDKVLLAADYSMVMWNRFHTGGILSEPTLDYMNGISIGGQLIPAPALLAPKYWETIRYRAGFRINQLPAKDNREWAFTLGAGLPFKAAGVANVVLEYGQRTDKNYSNYHEDFLSFSLGIAAGRKWAKSSAGSY